MKSRNSKDWKVNRKERCCVDGWGRGSIDGNFERDTEREWIYGKGKSVIDYLVRGLENTERSGKNNDRGEGGIESCDNCMDKKERRSSGKKEESYEIGGAGWTEMEMFRKVFGEKPVREDRVEEERKE